MSRAERLLGLSALRFQVPSPERLVAVDGWIRVVRELVGEGISDPQVLVFTLLGYQLGFTPTDSLVENFLEATDAVGQVVDEPPAKLRDEIVQRSSAGGASAVALLRAVTELRPVLERLPSVPVVSVLSFDVAARLVGVARMLAKRLAIEVLPAEPAAGWVQLLAPELQFLRRAPAAACVLPHETRIRFDDGRVLEPVDEDTARVTAAALLGLAPGSVDERWLVTEMLHNPRGVFEICGALRQKIQQMPGITMVETLPAFTPPPRVRIFASEAQWPVPPWVQHADQPSSLRWRTGGGEEALQDFAAFWRGLNAEQKTRSLARSPASSEWEAWLQAQTPR